MSEEHPTVRLTGTVGQRLAAAGLPARPSGTAGDYRVAPWLGDMLTTGIKLDSQLFAALVRVRDDPELREACLAAVRMAPEENCGKAVALGRLLGVPLPAWMEARAVFGKQRLADSVGLSLPEPDEVYPRRF